MSQKPKHSLEPWGPDIVLCVHHHEERDQQDHAFIELLESHIAAVADWHCACGTYVIGNTCSTCWKEKS